MYVCTCVRPTYIYISEYMLINKADFLLTLQQRDWDVNIISDEMGIIGLEFKF